MKNPCVSSWKLCLRRSKIVQNFHQLRRKDSTIFLYKFSCRNKNGSWKIENWIVLYIYTIISVNIDFLYRLLPRLNFKFNNFFLKFRPFTRWEILYTIMSINQHQFLLKTQKHHVLDISLNFNWFHYLVWWSALNLLVKFK